MTARLPAAHCVYCGEPVRSNARSCPAHRDLMELDEHWQAQRMRDWWLARYTLDEIVQLAAGLADTRSASEAARQAVPA